MIPLKYEIRYIQESFRGRMDRNSETKFTKTKEQTIEITGYKKDVGEIKRYIGKSNTKMRKLADLRKYICQCFFICGVFKPMPTMPSCMNLFERENI